MRISDWSSDVCSSDLALLLEGLVVVRDPLLGLGRVNEREGEGTDAELCGEVDGVPVRAGHPERRGRLLHRLGGDVAHGHREVLRSEGRRVGKEVVHEFRSTWSPDY